MSKLYAMICPARGGKSTYCKQWLKEKDPDGLNRVVVNADSIRLALHGNRYIASAEEIVHSIYTIMVKSLLMNDSLAVMMDDTHCSLNSIRKVLSLDSDAQFIYLDTPKNVCIERAYSTGQYDLIYKGVIDRMFKNLQLLQWEYVEDWTDIESIDHRDDYDNFEVTESRIIAAIEGVRRRVKNNA